MKKTKRDPSTTIEGLRAELASRRSRVEACQKQLDVAQSRAQAELDRAQASVDEYVAKIADALGLPNPRAREARRQETLLVKRRARELLASGKSADEVVAELRPDVDDPDRLVSLQAIVAKLTRRRDTGSYGKGGGSAGEKTPGDPHHLPPEAGKKGWKRERVRTMFLEGSSRREIADELDVSVECVGAHITQLRSQGRLPPAGESPAPAAGSKDAPGDDSGEAEGEAEGEGGGGDDDEVGDSVAELREEVARQQDGNRSRAVRMPVAVGGGDHHDHVAVLDRMGDGTTVADETGHVHKVYRFVVGGCAGHRHGGLLAKEA
jgi:hypothetical protein